jgi:DNA-binding CsgD family transcriptional regulator
MNALNSDGALPRGSSSSTSRRSRFVLQGTTGWSLPKVGMVRPDRLPVVASAAVAAGGVTVLVLVARSVAEPFWGTSLWVVLAMLFCAGVLITTYLRIGTGWSTWRMTLLGLTFIVIAYPGLWAGFAIAVESAPDGLPARITGALAGAGHVPLLAAFSVLPLLATRYLGRGRTRALVPSVAALGGVVVVLGTLFREDWSPATFGALVDWPPGAYAGMTLNLLFLTTTLLGPAMALAAARRAEAEARRRLALVSVAALGGVVLVLLCGLLGYLGERSGNGDAAVVALFIGMYAAVTAVGAGASRALDTPFATPTRTISRLAACLLAVVGAMAALTAVSIVDRLGPAAPFLAAVAAVLVMLAARPIEARVVRVISDQTQERRPAEDHVDRLGPLTERETEVLGLLAAGLSNAGIAARLVLSERTVDAHLRSVFAKLALPDARSENRRVHAVLAWHEAVRGSSGRGEQAS